MRWDLLTDVLEQHRARSRTIAAPELTTINTVVGPEIQPIIEDCKIGKGGKATDSGRGIDVLEHHGTRTGAIADPKLFAIDTVVGAEQQL